MKETVWGVRAKWVFGCMACMLGTLGTMFLLLYVVNQGTSKEPRLFSGHASSTRYVPPKPSPPKAGPTTDPHVHNWHSSPPHASLVLASSSHREPSLVQAVHGQRFPYGRSFCILPPTSTIRAKPGEEYPSEWGSSGFIDLSSELEVLYVHVGPDLEYGRHLLRSFQQLRAFNPSVPATALMSRAAFESDPLYERLMRCHGIRVVFLDDLAEDELVKSADRSFYMGSINMGGVNTPADFNKRTSLRMFYVHAYMARRTVARRAFHLENDNVPFEDLRLLDEALIWAGVQVPASPPRSSDRMYLVLGFMYIPNLESFRRMLDWWLGVFEAGAGRTREFLDTDDLNDMTLSAGYHRRHPEAFVVLTGLGGEMDDPKPFWAKLPGYVDNGAVCLWFFGDFHNRRPKYNEHGWGAYTSFDPRKFELFWLREPSNYACSRPYLRSVVDPTLVVPMLSFHVHMKDVENHFSGCRAYQRLGLDALWRAGEALLADHAALRDSFGFPPNGPFPLMSREAVLTSSPLIGSQMHVLDLDLASSEAEAHEAAESMASSALQQNVPLVLYSAKHRWLTSHWALAESGALRDMLRSPSHVVYSTDCRVPSAKAEDLPALRCLPVGVAPEMEPWILPKMRDLAVAQAEPVRKLVMLEESAAREYRVLDDSALSTATVPSSRKSSPQEYLDELSSHMFVVCPPSRSGDAAMTNVHCAWEALLVGTVPIVVGEMDPAFEDLPVLFAAQDSLLSLASLEDSIQRLASSASSFLMDKVLYYHYAGEIRALSQNPTEPGKSVVIDRSL